MTDLERLVDLVPYLANRPVVSVAKVAQDFGVTPERVIKDLEVLQFVGLPGYYPGDLFEVDLDGARADGYIMARNVDALARPVRLTPDQAASLSAALRLLLDLGAGEGAQTALQKLESIGKTVQNLQIAVERGAPEINRMLADAIAQHQAITIRYLAAGESDSQDLVVEPHRIRTAAGYAYLDAWSRQRNGWRTFRLDRIQEAWLLDENCVERKIPDQLDVWFADVQRELTIEISAAGKWCADYHPTTSVRQIGENWLITFPLANRRWALDLLLRLGESVLSVSDEELGKLARESALRALANYG